MNKKIYWIVGLALMVYAGVCAFTATHARADESQKTPIFLHFWKTDGEHAEMVNFTIPRTGEVCPDGFSRTENPTYCGRDIFVSVTRHENGALYKRLEILRHERSPSGYWRAYVRTLPGLREIEVEPFRDDLGLMLSVTGTIRLRLDKNEWRVIKRVPERSFFAETEPGFPFILNLECVAGIPESRASL
ncbi:MAG: hypothetical protein AAB579_02155 [Patescibacteria group bacterium]